MAKAPQVDPDTIPAVRKEAEPVKVEKGECPYCKSQNQKSRLVMERTRLQCMECGKHWDESAIGKPYSIELERGEDWAREQQLKALRK